MFNAKYLIFTITLLAAIISRAPLRAMDEAMDVEEQEEMITTREFAFLVKYLAATHYFSDKLIPEVTSQIFCTLLSLMRQATIEFPQCEMTTRNMPILDHKPRIPSQDFLALISWLDKSRSRDLTIRLLSMVEFDELGAALCKASECGDFDNLLIILAMAQNHELHGSWTTWQLLSNSKNLTLGKNQTALDFAIRAGHTKIVQALVDAAGPNAPWLLKISPQSFILAEDGGHAKILEILLKVPKLPHNTLQNCALRQIAAIEQDLAQEDEETEPHAHHSRFKRLKRTAKSACKALFN